jgi:hypothetical protein
MTKSRTRKRPEHRRKARVAADLPVELDRTPGVMRDVSATGIFFETDAEYEVGNPIDVKLSLDTPWGRVSVVCDGKIVRVESHEGRVGVAVQFTDPGAGAEPAAAGARPARRKR